MKDVDQIIIESAEAAIAASASSIDRNLIIHYDQLYQVSEAAEAAAAEAAEAALLQKL